MNTPGAPLPTFENFVTPTGRNASVSGNLLGSIEIDGLAQNDAGKIYTAIQKAEKDMTTLRERVGRVTKDMKEVDRAAKSIVKDGGPDNPYASFTVAPCELSVVGGGNGNYEIYLTVGGMTAGHDSTVGDFSKAVQKAVTNAGIGGSVTLPVVTGYRFEFQIKY